MNVFLDTNVILENFLVREEFTIAHRLFDELHVHKHVLFMSVGSFYTMIFLVDKYLKKEYGLHGDSRMLTLRKMMSNILQTVRVAEHDNDSLLRGINNIQFMDVEDGCQYQVAQKVSCELLITFNIADYPTNDDAPVQVLTPQQYLELNTNQ